MSQHIYIMKRLFLALEIPEPIQVQLKHLQAAAPPGCRLTPQKDMHLTLVFLGQAEPERISNALTDFSHEAPTLALDQPGCFSNSNGMTFWTGTEPNTSLLNLHNDLLTRLRQSGFEPDDKPLRPHITLARCNHKPSDIDRAVFLNQRLPEGSNRFFQVRQVALYSSATLPSGPVYQVESRCPLIIS